MMRKIGQFALVGTLFLLLAANVQATDSRKIVLTGAFYHELTPSGMVITTADSLLNPIYMLDNPNYVNIDYDGAIYSGFGVAKMEPFGLPGVLGLQIGKRYGSYRDDIWAGPGQNISDLNGLVTPICGQTNVGVDGVNVTNIDGVRSFGLYYALPLKNGLKVGFGLNTVGRGVSGRRINDPLSVSTERDDRFKKKISALMLRAGLGYQIKENINLAVDIGLGYPKYLYRYTTETGSTADNEKASFTGTDMDINAKVNYTLSEGTDFVANLSYLSYGGSLKVDPDTDTDDDATTYGRAQKSLVFLAGPLFHGEGYNVGFQVGFMSDKSEEETKVETVDTDTQKNNPRISYFPILRILAEKQVFNWFTMRASLTFETSSEKILTNPDTDPATENWTTISAQAASSLTPAFGFTVNLKKGFFIEAYMYDTIFLEGPWFLTGNSSGPDLNIGVSLGVRL
jgi:opacity protein-like surface antigen